MPNKYLDEWMQPDWLLKTSKSDHLPTPQTPFNSPTPVASHYCQNKIQTPSHALQGSQWSGPWLKPTPSPAFPPWLMTFQPLWPSCSSWNLLSSFLPLAAHSASRSFYLAGSLWPFRSLLKYCFCKIASLDHPRWKQPSQQSFYPALPMTLLTVIIVMITD